MKKQLRAFCLGLLMATAFAGIITSPLWLLRPAESVSERPDPTLHPGAGDVVDATVAAKKAKSAATRLFLVIDDAGQNLDEIEHFLRLPIAYTVAVLPGLPATEESARLAVEAGKEVILHQPMEAESGANPGPGSIHADMTVQVALDVLERNLRSIPQARGVNNHMGSKATARLDLMESLIQYLADRSLYFLDSRTTPATAAPQASRNRGILIAERQVFLDNDRKPEAILAALEQGKRVAKERGYAVLIGHAWCTELADILLEVYPHFLDEGFAFYHLSEFFKRAESDAGSRN